MVLTLLLPITVSAEVTTYSDVMEDLEKDSSFDVTDYPLMTYDYFASLNSDEDETNDVEYLSVIHIGESENGELFVYTYQPLNNVSDIVASSISMSTSESSLLDMAIAEGSVNFEKYTLKCVSREGPFKKYLVEDFVVSSDFYRYYSISEIERPFDTLLDEKISDEVVTDSKTHAIGQAWCCYYENDELMYEMATIDVVGITPTHTGELYYENGITWGSLVGIDSSCVSHYISFNIEKKYDVEKIIDASLEYKYRDYRTVHTIDSGIAPSILSLFGVDNEYTATTYPNGTDYTEVSLDIHENDVVNHDGEGLWAKDYSWNRIMTGQNFVIQYESQGGEWNESIKTTVENSQFVFAFTETEISTSQSYTTTGNDIYATTTYTTVLEGTEVAEIDILRLKFVSEGVTYNLGVVSDTVSSDGVADGVASGLDITDLEEYLEDFLTFMMLIIFVVIVLVLLVYVKPVASMIGKGFAEIIGLIWTVITLPFQLIASLFSSKRR